ncbi:MAG: DinB family protein [Fimbriimonadales bacterium]
MLQLYQFGRARLAASLEGLSDEQIGWRPHDGAHTIAEILYHLAGAEHYWWARLTPISETDPRFDKRLDAAVFEGFLRDGRCAFSGEELRLAAVHSCLRQSRENIEPILSKPTAEQLSQRLMSPIGDEVSGEEGLIRLCSHAPYHVGQIWMIRMHPEFPA